MSKTQLLDYRVQLLDRLARQPVELTETLRTAPETFGLLHHVARLRDLEAQTFVPGLRRLLTEEHPALELPPPSDDAQPGEPLSQLLDDFVQAREELVTLARALPPEGWNRAGFYPPWGARTVQWWVERVYAQTQECLAELRRVVTPDT